VVGRNSYVLKWGEVIAFSITAGIVGGLGAVIFRLLIKATHEIFFVWLLPRISFHVDGFNLGYILLPAIGGIGVAVLVVKYPKIKGNGIPEVVEAIIFKSGNISGKFATIKILATSITIGSGGSVGREGPIGFIGASLTSFLAGRAHLSRDMKKLLTTCGLATGIAGTFNTPLAGAMFALEVVYMGTFSINLVPIFIASVTGNAVTLAILQRAFEVEIPGGLGHTAFELPIFFVMGLLLGILAAFYARFIYYLTDSFSSWKVPEFIKPITGGIGVGIIGTLLPLYGIFGVGYGGMNMAFYGKLSLGLLVVLGIAKMLATALTLGSGHSGGIFAPSLYIGTMFGAAFGMVVKAIFPTLGANPTVYALAGMAAFFSGITQAPVTQILMVTELTRSYAVLPAIMTSATMGFLTSRFFLKGDSIYTLKLTHKGYTIRTGKPVILETIPVGEIMTKEPVYVYEDQSLLDVEHLVAKTGHDCFPVVNRDLEVGGVVGVKDFIKRPTSLKRLPVKRFVHGDYGVTYPSETAADAFEKLMAYDQNLLPVLESRESSKLVGVVTKRDIYKAYYRGLEAMYIE